MGSRKGHDAAFKELEAEFEVPRDHEVISVTSKLIAPTIDEYGTPAQRERWCRQLLPAWTSSAVSCSPSRAPAATSPDSPAEAVRDGDEWVLDGQKVWTSTARIAQYGFAICRTDPTSQARRH